MPGKALILTGWTTSRSQSSPRTTIMPGKCSGEPFRKARWTFLERFVSAGVSSHLAEQYAKDRNGHGMPWR